MDETIKKIILAASKAPSGENAQPWKFKIEKNKIHQFNVPERDQSFYNWGQRASYIAHGAALENIFIAAGAHGYEARADLFPNPDDENLVATINLNKIDGHDGELYPYIEERITNRKPYKKEPLSEKQKKALQSIAIDGAEFRLTESRNDIKELASVGGMNEQIMLETKDIHNFFFDHINWTKEEELAKRYGFYIETLELPPPARFMFKIFSKWSRWQFFKRLGFAKMVAHQNAQVYASAGAMGIIAIPSTKPNDFMSAGMLLERLWLTATQHGLSIQPMTGVLFFKLQLDSGNETLFAPEHQELIKTNYSTIENIFGIKGGHIAMLFRIGVGDSPTAQSARFPLEKNIIQ